MTQHFQNGHGAHLVTSTEKKTTYAVGIDHGELGIKTDWGAELVLQLQHEKLAAPYVLKVPATSDLRLSYRDAQALRDLLTLALGEQV